MTTLVTFNLINGANPYAGLIMDGSGNLFGTTFYHGSSGYGTVFELAKQGGGYSNTVTTLASFNGSNGANPYAGLIMDGSGDLYGTTTGGGSSGYDTVFELAKQGGGYSNTVTTLASLGYYSYAGLIMDGSGNLYGTTYGTVFELAKQGGGYSNTVTTLATFNGSNGEYLRAGLIMDGSGNLYSTTEGGGSSSWHRLRAG